jgi:hypothetical protein
MICPASASLGLEVRVSKKQLEKYGAGSTLYADRRPPFGLVGNLITTGAEGSAVAPMARCAPGCRWSAIEGLELPNAAAFTEGFGRSGTLGGPAVAIRATAVGWRIRQATRNSTIPVPRCGFSRARDIGTENSNGILPYCSWRLRSCAGQDVWFFK